MKTLLTIFLAIVLFTSCSKKQAIIFSNDTETQEWLNQTTIRELPNTHSGKSVSVIDSLNLYSLGFKKMIGKINSEKISSATFSYWVYLKSPDAKANTVFSIDFEGKNIIWQGIPIQDKVKEYNKWVQISETFSMPENVDTKNFLTLYVWNISKEEILIDDIQIEFK